MKRQTEDALFAMPFKAERVGRAMLRIAKKGFPKTVLENPDMNAASRG
jgi:hypothetical protein